MIYNMCVCLCVCYIYIFICIYIYINIRACLFILSEMLTHLVAFTSSDVTVLQRLSKVAVMSVG